MSAFSVRLATPGDAVAMSRVLIASIVELCGADHHGDAAAIAGWTRNKTPEEIAKFFANPQNTLFVAERDGGVVAVGCIGEDGTIRLNYVAPEHRFAGVSTALLAAMEAALKARGVAVGRLTSTTTAHRFYRSRGWIDDGAADGGQPMRKRL